MRGIPNSVLDQLGKLTANHAEIHLIGKTVSTSFGATAAGATTALTVPTQDDNLVRVVIGLWYGGTTELARIQLLSSGRLFSDIDAGSFSSSYGFQDVFVPFAANIQILAQLLNGSNGSVAAHALTLRYIAYDPKFNL